MTHVAIAASRETLLRRSKFITAPIGVCVMLAPIRSTNEFKFAAMKVAPRQTDSGSTLLHLRRVWTNRVDLFATR